VPVQEIRLRTERRTQLIDITERVREALDGTSGAAVLVYVPHTTAGVTINEKIDPDLVEDLEHFFEKIVGDDWGWTHDDKDGPNGPSHGRASVTGPQVLVPLRDGALGLGTYQAVFLCEFDGPKDRSVYVSVLQ
jgi:secondary thiamine-phosphate synthase enzyme